MVKNKIISGIQQVGIGVSDVHKAWKWYRQHFGIDIKIFEEKATAKLMLPYTGGKPQERHAVLTYNLQGGGGFEIWQYTERTPEPPVKEILLGDLGIFATKIKSKVVTNAFNFLNSTHVNILGKVMKDPLKARQHFFLKDPFNNIFEIVESQTWFNYKNKPTGSVYGVSIGVKDMDRSIDFYKSILDYNTIIYDVTGTFEDLAPLPGGNSAFRRVLLGHEKPRVGGFSRFFGTSVIELFQVLDREPKKIYADRFWGDLGFIHLCFDIFGIDKLREQCEKYGHPFTVDSASSFDMGEAAGHFSYIEDPDGTLIEFVETHKLPLVKKLGWYLDMRKRKPEVPLPDWMLRFLKYSRVKD